MRTHETSQDLIQLTKKPLVDSRDRLAIPAVNPDWITPNTKCAYLRGIPSISRLPLCCAAHRLAAERVARQPKPRRDKTLSVS